MWLQCGTVSQVFLIQPLVRRTESTGLNSLWRENNAHLWNYDGLKEVCRFSTWLIVRVMHSRAALSCLICYSELVPHKISRRSHAHSQGRRSSNPSANPGNKACAQQAGAGGFTADPPAAPNSLPYSSNYSVSTCGFDVKSWNNESYQLLNKKQEDRKTAI